jgi:hypothetical protein
MSIARKRCRESGLRSGRNALAAHWAHLVGVWARLMRRSLAHRFLVPNRPKAHDSGMRSVFALRLRKTRGLAYLDPRQSAQ